MFIVEANQFYGVENEKNKQRISVLSLYTEFIQWTQTPNN